MNKTIYVGLFCLYLIICLIGIEIIFLVYNYLTYLFNEQIKQLNFFDGYFQALTLSSAVTFTPLKSYSNLTDTKDMRKDLQNVAGVYGIINTKTSQQYIGSSLNLQHRLTDHIKGRDSNKRLQRSIKKYGLNNFKIVIYYFHVNSHLPKAKHVLLTDMETQIIQSFNFTSLYNFKKEANSSLGYKHTIKTKEKFKLRYKDKKNHPMFGKTHDKPTIALISKPGKLNPMFGKSHSLLAREKMSLKKSIKPVGLYDINNNLIKVYLNQVLLADKLGVTKSTVNKYIKSGKLFQKKFFIKLLDS